MPTLVLVSNQASEARAEAAEPHACFRPPSAECAALHQIEVLHDLINRSLLPNFLLFTDDAASRGIARLVASQSQQQERAWRPHRRRTVRWQHALVREGLLPRYEPPPPSQAPEAGIRRKLPAEPPRELLYRPSWMEIVRLLHDLRGRPDSIGMIVSDHALVAAIDHRLQAEFTGAERQTCQECVIYRFSVSTLGRVLPRHPLLRPPAARRA